MRVDVSRSRYREAPVARDEFSRRELKRARFLLRRLRFLEQQVREREERGEDPTSNGGVFAELEIESLEWALGPDGLDFLEPYK